MKNVTVIVPVYKDWSTLDVCIESLKECLNSRHKVLLINDKGPEWQDLEQKIMASIQGYSNFEYFCNTENMGFVKTCNRGIQELDSTDNDILLLNSDTRVTDGFLEEMLRILYQAEKHGVVCPRSNQATLLAVPFHKNTTEEITFEESYALYQKVRPLLPEKQVIPTGVGFAFLVKRSLLKSFGVLDEIYGKGYNEENDFCMRVNQYGYDIMMSNYSYVFHYESKSFGDMKEALDAKNNVILLKRYPYYEQIVHRYFRTEINAIDYFADLFSDTLYPKKRVLFSLYEIPSAYNGTAVYGLAILEAFYQLYADKYDIHVLIRRSAGEFFRLKEKYPHVYYPEELEGNTFHIAFSPCQIFNVEHMFLLNKTSLKYVFCMQDIISIRSKYLVIQDYERRDLFRQSIHFCDGMMSISRFSLDDTKAYYSREFERREISTRVIYLGTGIPQGYVPKRAGKMVFEHYFIIFGNHYRHKLLQEILSVLKASKYNFIMVGSKMTGRISENIYGYESGMLPDELIESLVYQSDGILFPSVYEGFGLPILKGIDYDKKVIVNNNEVNRELKEYFGNFGRDNIYMFDELEEVEGLLDKVCEHPQVVYADGEKKLRTWRDTAVEVEEFLAEIMDSPIDKERLLDRWEYYNYLEEVHGGIELDGKSVHSNFMTRCKVYIKTHCQFLYRFLVRLRDTINHKKKGRTG